MTTTEAIDALNSGRSIAAVADLTAFGGNRTLFQIKKYHNKYGLPAYRISEKGRMTKIPILSDAQLTDWLSSISIL